MSVLLMLLFACDVERPELTLDTADTAIVWGDPEPEPPVTSVVWGVSQLAQPAVCTVPAQVSP